MSNKNFDNQILKNMSDKKQTAVEQFAIALYEAGYLQGNGDEIETLLNTFQAMEKERIIKSFDDGDYNYHYSRKTGNDFENGEEYFEELYGGNK
jgi:hypothetical protein